MRNTAVLLSPIIALAIGVTLCGCTTINDCKYECDQKLRAHQAWCAFDGSQDECFTGDYRTGWKAGYYDVATGGTSCPPVVPPRKYWHPPVCFEYDPCRRNEWYCGWQDGAACAKSEPDFHHLQAWMECGPVCCRTQNISYPSMPMSSPSMDVPMESLPPGAEAAPSDMSDPMPGLDDNQMPPITVPATDAPAVAPGYDKDPMPHPAGTDSAAPVDPTEPAKPNAQRRLPADFIALQRLVDNAPQQQKSTTPAKPKPAAGIPAPTQVSNQPARESGSETSMLHLLVRNATGSR